jgi:hypothetical protein
MKTDAIFYGSAIIAIFSAIIIFCIALLIAMVKHGGYSRKIPIPPAKLNPKFKK